jgi:hypothetical protein
MIIMFIMSWKAIKSSGIFFASRGQQNKLMFCSKVTTRFHMYGIPIDLVLYHVYIHRVKLPK